ncbi:hypothetical protein [Haloferax sp. DFSO52]|uniref:hypothetical protein n=1 Tax=Haloferax sp. DFSO52 TaxID=3388505 RepID=UPI003A8B5BCD
MSLDVENPSSPDLTNRGTPIEFSPDESIGSEADFRRAELEEFLHDGAWKEAFEEWAVYTDLSDREYEQVLDLGLLDQVDFFWDPSASRVRFAIPPIPHEWPNGTDISSKVSAELTDLGQTVVEMLEDGYIDWASDERAERVWSEEKSSEESTLEE